MATANGKKRYNIVLPDELHNTLKDVAAERHVTVVELIRQFIKLGLLAIDEQKTLILKDSDGEKELLIL